MQGSSPFLLMGPQQPGVPVFIWWGARSYVVLNEDLILSLSLNLGPLTPSDLGHDTSASHSSSQKAFFICKKRDEKTSSGDIEQHHRFRTLLLVGPHFYGEENWSPERLSNLPIVIQLIYGRARISFSVPVVLAAPLSWTEEKGCRRLRRM